MQIHVARPPTQLGVFSPEEIAEGLRTGRFLANDQGWREGMAAWMPLGQWAEFAAVAAGAGVPDSPVANGASSPQFSEAPSGESTLPWEQERSVASIWKTWLALLRSPSESLASAKLGFVSTLQLSWAIAAAFSLCALIGGVLYAEQTAAVMRQLGAALTTAAQQMHGPLAELVGSLANYLAHSEPKGFFTVLLQTALFLLLSPFLHLFYGLLQWLALRLFGLCGASSCKAIPLGRTANAVVLAMAAANFCLMLTVLLPPGKMQNIVMYVAIIPFMTIYARVVGGAVRVNPWIVFASVVVFYCVFVGCFACAIGTLAATMLG